MPKDLDGAQQPLKSSVLG